MFWSAGETIEWNQGLEEDITNSSSASATGEKWNKPVELGRWVPLQLKGNFHKPAVKTCNVLEQNVQQQKKKKKKSTCSLKWCEVERRGSPFSETLTWWIY